MKEMKSEIFQIRRPAKMSNFYKLFATGLGIALIAFLIFGCSTETPWEPPATQLLTVNIITGPDSTTAVPHTSHVTFTWSARGGSGVMSGYQFYLEGVETTWRSLTDTTAATYTNLVGPDTLTFHIRVVDSKTATAVDSRWFAVSDTAAAVPNTDRPAVSFASVPEESSFVAVGKSVTFTWSVSDNFPANGVILCRHILNPGGTWSDWSEATSANYANLTARDPAVFIVQAKDEDDSTSTDSTSVFIIKSASILWIDDYVFTDAYGNVDRIAERAEATYYHNLMEGFAFADWDYNDEDSLPTLAGLQAMGITTIVWNAEDGDANGTLWVEIGAAGGGVLKDFCDVGGNVLITGSTALGYMYNTNPPSPGDFEAYYLGLDTTYAWGGGDYFTWAWQSEYTWTVGDTGTYFNYSDISNWTGAVDTVAVWGDSVTTGSKMDVAKDGSQLRYCDALPVYFTTIDTVNFLAVADSAAIKEGVEVGFINGIDVDGWLTYYFGWPIAIRYDVPDPAGKTALATFDTYYMPEADMREMFIKVLEYFGE